MKCLSIALLCLLSTAAWALSGTSALNNTEPTSFSLSCAIEDLNTSEPSHIGVVKVTGQNIGSSPIIHWKAPSAKWVTLVLRPIDERTWASRVELGNEDGTHQLQCMIVGSSGGEIIARTYRMVTPEKQLTETGMPEIWSQGSAQAEVPAVAMMPAIIEAPKPVEAKTRFSAVLAGVIVFLINIVFLFGVGIGFMVHRRRKAHADVAELHEIHQKFVQAGLMESDGAAPEPVIPVEPAKIDVTEIVAAVTVTESMNETVDRAEEQAAAAEPAAEEPQKEPAEEPKDNGVDIRKTSEEEEEKIDLHDLSF